MPAKPNCDVTKKRISVSGKRQITIPLDFYNQLGIDKEVECFVCNGCLIIRPSTSEGDGEFSEQILADLLAQGLQGNELLNRFKLINRSVHSAAIALQKEADDIASGKAPSATMHDLFDLED